MTGPHDRSKASSRSRAAGSLLLAPAKLTDVARGLRRRQTGAEARLWFRIRNRQLDGLKFRRQVPRGRFVADFLCDEAMLILEIDGSQHADRTVEDQARTADLEGLGYCVLRFWNVDVLKHTNRVLDHIHAVATERRKGASPGADQLPKRRSAGMRGSGSDTL